MGFGVEWILAKVFLIGKDFHDRYAAFRVSMGDTNKEHYQVALRTVDGHLAVFLKHLPTGREERVKQF